MAKKKGTLGSLLRQNPTLVVGSIRIKFDHGGGPKIDKHEFFFFFR